MTPFVQCPECHREVMVIPHKGGWRFRIHTGRFGGWCPNSHKATEV